jgi:hypothetical protein
VAQVAAQARYEHIERAAVGKALVAPQRLQHIGAREHLVALVEQALEQFGLAVRELYFGLAAIGQAQALLRVVEAVAANGQRLPRAGSAPPYPPAQLNANTSADFSRGQSYINGRPNLARTWRLAQTLSANSAYNERLVLGLNANFTYQQAEYSLSPVANAAYFTQPISGDVYWRLPDKAARMIRQAQHDVLLITN